MKKLLITGVSGFLGWHLCQVAQARPLLDLAWPNLAAPNLAAPNLAAPNPASPAPEPAWQIYGTYHSRPVQLAGVTSFPLDLTDLASLKLIVQSLKPDAVLHIAALSSPNLCQAEPALSEQINVTASAHLAGLCADAQIPCLFTSSEQVFDGRNPPYREADPVCPINQYGEHKAKAEVAMRTRCPDVIICRMPLLYGAAPADSFIQPWIKALRIGQPVNLFTDEIRNPVWGGDAAAGLLLMLEKRSDLLATQADTKGLVHLGGPERLSRYQLGQILAQVLQIADAKLNPCQQADVKMAAPRPPDASLDSSLAFSLGYRPQRIQDVLPRLHL